MKIPFMDLLAQHNELRAEIDATVKEIIDRSSFIGGSYVQTFEKNFAAFCGAKYAVVCASGTDALKLALMGAGVRRGDEVITTPLTFIATVEAMTQVGAYPAFVDIDPHTYNLSTDRLTDFLQKDCRLDRDSQLVNIKTGRPITAIVPVHLYGLPVDMTTVLDLADQYNLRIVEDACQAHGAIYYSGQKSEVRSQKYKGNLNSINTADSMERYACKVGTLGDAGAFSFYPGKNLGAMGEGGAVTTDDERMERHMRIWRDHGQSERYVHVSPDGWNGRLDALQCAILDIKLKKLDEWNERRRRAAKWYAARLCEDDRIILPVEPEGRKHVYHLFVVRVSNREKVLQKLMKRNIGVGLHYPIPLHLQRAYHDLGWKHREFPEAEEAARSILSLPLFPHITEEQVGYVCSSLQAVLGD